MAKTPVSMLQEFSVKYGLTPVYTLIVNEVGSHNPFYKYKLTVGDVTSFGDGKSKKEAKHEAARHAIIIMENSQAVKDKREHSGDKIDKNQDFSSESIDLPYQGAVTENSIGCLATFCARNRIPLPEYSVIGEEGPPHAKVFTIECKVGHLKETAKSRTKQQAKHISSMQVMERLKSVVDTFIPSYNEEREREFEKTMEKVKELYISIKSKRKKITTNLNNVTDYDNLPLDDIRSDTCRQILQEYRLNCHESSCEPFKVLGNLFESANRTVTYTFVEPNEKVKTIRCFCEMDQSPNLVTPGKGRTLSEARNDSAHSLLLYLADLI